MTGEAIILEKRNDQGTLLQYFSDSASKHPTQLLTDESAEGGSAQLSELFKNFYSESAKSERLVYGKNYLILGSK